MTHEFIIEPEVWKRFPGMALVCVAGRGLDNKTKRESIDNALGRARDAAFETLRAVDFDEFAPITTWRRLQPGRDFPAAHEALAARVKARSPLRSINPLVDLYNSISIDLIGREVAAPIGAWCMTMLPGLRLGITKGSESFTELGKSDLVAVEADEIAYMNLEATELITRHFVWRQSRLGAISPATKSFFLVSELAPPFATEGGALEAEIVQSIGDHLAIGCDSTVLVEGDERWSWRG